MSKRKNINEYSFAVAFDSIITCKCSNEKDSDIADIKKNRHHKMEREFGKKRERFHNKIARGDIRRLIDFACFTYFD